MGLQVWLPLNGNLNNQGLSDITITGTPSYNNYGKIGQCLSSVLTLSNYSSYLQPSHTNSISIACWVKNTTSDYIIACSAFEYRCSPSSVQFRLGDGGTNTYAATSSVKAVADTWNHIVGVWDATTKQVLCYLNGVKVGEYQANSSINFNTISSSFRLPWNGTNVYLNDLRFYNNALSSKEVEEISKGLVLHYKLDDEYIENTTNIATYPTPGSAVGSIGWDTTKHTDAIYVSGWSCGYNSGVSNPSTGYHAYWKIIDNIPTIVFPDKNSEISQTHRWLGVSGGGITTSQIYAGITYTISMEAKADIAGKIISTGLYYKQTSDGGYAFHDGCSGKTITTEWKKYSWTYTCTAIYNNPSMYIYGMYGVEGTSYIRNIQVEIKDHSTAYTQNSRNNSIIYDSSGYGYNGTISGSLSINHESPRYNKSIYIDSSSTISHNKSLDSSNQEWTCCAWVKPTSSGGYQNLNNFNDANRIYHGTYPLLYLNSGTNDYYNYGNQAVSANTWQHIAFVFKNSEGLKNIYINGINKTNTSGPNKTSTPSGIPNTVIIGSGYTGYISDYREYATALTATQIKELYDTSASISNNGTLFTREVIEE